MTSESSEPHKICEQAFALERAAHGFLQEQKNEQAFVEQNDGFRERRACFKELNRLYSAIDSIKTTLRLRGIDFEFDHWDEEHPNAAYRRYLKEWEEQWAEERREREAQSSCYVVTAVFGSASRELEAAIGVCRARFALNPLVTPSWLAYQLIGPSIARYARTGQGPAAIVRRLVADPIVRASNADLLHALPWIVYLALPGWLVVLSIATILHSASGG